MRKGIAVKNILNIKIHICKKNHPTLSKYSWNISWNGESFEEILTSL